MHKPIFLFFLLSAMQKLSRSVEYPCPLNEPDTHRQSMYIYPSAEIGIHAFSAGIYSIKHFPRSTLFKNTKPSSNRSDSHAFFDETCMSLLFEMAQQICSFSIFSFVTCMYSINQSPIGNFYAAKKPYNTAVYCIMQLYLCQRKIKIYGIFYEIFKY